jgi:hypothetical protein
MKRTKSIKIRLTDGELRRLKTCAGPRGVSAFLRVRALGPDRRQLQTERLNFLAEFARARNLLNQIARSSEKRPLPEQFQIVAQLIAVERVLSKLKKS